MRPPGALHRLACKQRRYVRKLQIGIEQEIEFLQPAEEFPQSMRGSPKSDVLFYDFHPVVDDGTVADTIQELPHAARNGSCAAHHMRKIGAV
jgi:hypothetical protein